jgi:glycosyltransferase involved in cell wall biosynthesis
MKKTIGFFDCSTGGGTARYFSILISGMSRDEFDLILFALSPQAWHRELESLGVRVVTLAPGTAAGASPEGQGPDPPKRRRRRIPLPKSFGWWLWMVLQTIKLRRLFKEHPVDLLHWNNIGVEAAPFAARLAGVSVVLSTLHVDSTYDLDGSRRGLQYRLLDMLCMRSLHHSISVSRATAVEWFRRCRLPESYWRKVTIVHNGISVESLRRRLPLAQAKAQAGLTGRLVIGCLGRLQPAKGYEFLIRALPSIVAAYPQTLLRIAGPGTLLPQLTDLARSLGVERHLEFTGHTADIRSFLEAIDIFVQPSLCEALPFTILEACSVGMPVVATDVGGVSECIRDGETGLVVPARDPEALSRAILMLAGDAPLRQAMAERAQAFMLEGFQSTMMVEKTVAVYRGLLGVELAG